MMKILPVVPVGFIPQIDQPHPATELEFARTTRIQQGQAASGASLIGGIERNCWDPRTWR